MKISRHLFKIITVLILLVGFLFGYFLGFKLSKKVSDINLEEPVYKLLDRIHNLEE